MSISLCAPVLYIVGGMPFFKVGASAECTAVSCKNGDVEGGLGVEPGVEGFELAVAQVIDAI